MKRFALFFLILALCVSLCGCVFIRVYEKNDISRSAAAVEKIEFYNICDDVGLYPKYSIPKNEPSIDELDEYYSPVSELPVYRYEAFISDLNDLSFRRVYVSVNDDIYRTERNYMGIAAKITYSDGSLEIVTQYAQISYTSGVAYEYLSECRDHSWNSFISKYYGG